MVEDIDKKVNENTLSLFNLETILTELKTKNKVDDKHRRVSAKTTKNNPLQKKTKKNKDTNNGLIEAIIKLTK